MLDAGGVFKDVGAFGEVIDEEVGGGVAGAFVGQRERVSPRILTKIGNSYHPG